MFAADGSLWLLMGAGDHDQLFRMKIGAKPVQVSKFGADVGGFKLAPSGDRVVVWADTPNCSDLACSTAQLPAKPAGSGRTSTSSSSATGTAGPSRGSNLGCSLSRSSAASSPAAASRLTGNLDGDTPSKPFGGGEEIAISPDGNTVYFALREAGRIEPLSTNLDIFQSPSDGSARRST